MSRARLLLGAASLPVVLASVVAGCAQDVRAGYCDRVADHQDELSAVAASDDPGALFDALDDYDDLAAEAPRDVADDWRAVVGPLHDLQDALAAHDVDPSTYSAEEPPAGVDAAARRDIEAAAREVGSERTVTAMAAVEQHALDVCGTPLSR